MHSTSRKVLTHEYVMSFSEQVHDHTYTLHYATYNYLYNTNWTEK